MWYIYTMEYYSSLKKEQNNAICTNMDGPGDYAKWIKTDRERQISYDITNMWNLIKIDKNELIYKTERDSDLEIKGEIWGGRDKLGVWD